MPSKIVYQTSCIAETALKQPYLDRFHHMDVHMYVHVHIILHDWKFDLIIYLLPN